MTAELLDRILERLRGVDPGKCQEIGRSAFPSRRAMSAKLWPRSTSFIHLRALAMAISKSCRLPGFIGVLCAGR
jgi:hypothetical protein